MILLTAADEKEDHGSTAYTMRFLPGFFATHMARSAILIMSSADLTGRRKVTAPMLKVTGVRKNEEAEVRPILFPSSYVAGHIEP
jgi:hypothetical protein